MDPKQLKTFKELGDLYKILGIEPTKDEKIIKKAYRKQAIQVFPDKIRDPNEKEWFIRLQQAYNILMHPEQKKLYDKYNDNQKYNEERVTGQNIARRQFGEEILKREKANQEAGEADKEYKITKEEQKREEGKRMKGEWEEEEQRLKEDLEKKRKVEKTEEKESTTIKVKWSKNDKMIYTEELLNLLFKKYGNIKNVMVFADDRKAVIEFKYRLSAEKAYQENKAKAKEIDDGLKVSLLFKERASDQQTGYMSWNSGNLDKISSLLTREDQLRREQERQEILDEMTKEGVV